MTERGNMLQNKNIKEKRTKSKFTLATALVFAFLCLYIIMLMIPFVWTFITSVKTDWDFMSNKFGLPSPEHGWAWSNYSAVFDNFYVTYIGETYRQKFYMGEMFFNSVLYSVSSAFVATLVPFITAYATTRFRFKFSAVVDTVVIVTMILPIVGSLPSSIQVAKTLGMMNSMIGNLIMKANFLGMYYLYFGASFRAIPKALTEAAEIDGASNWKVLLKIIVPLSASMFFTIFILRFVAFWNDYQTPMIFLKNYPTASYGLWYFKNSSDGAIASTPIKLAASVTVVLPILLVFIVFHKRMMKGVSMSEGVKE